MINVPCPVAIYVLRGKADIQNLANVVMELLWRYNNKNKMTNFFPEEKREGKISRVKIFDQSQIINPNLP